MDDYEGKQIVFYRDSERFYGIDPLHDYNVGVVYTGKEGVAFDLRGYLNHTYEGHVWTLNLYKRVTAKGSLMKIVHTFGPGTALSDMTSVLYSMVLLGMDDGETDLEKEARMGR